MMRTRLKPDKRSAATLAALLVGLVAGGGALVYQQETSLASEVKTLQAVQKQCNESARIASTLQMTEARYKQDNDRLKFLEAALPSREYVPTLLKQIEQLCVDTHNQVRSVRPDAHPAPPPRPVDRRTDPEAQGSDDPNKPAEKPKPADPYDRLQIQVALTGGFQEYQSFLQRLTKFPKIVAVDQVQLRPHPNPDHPGPEPQLDVDMQLTAFIHKDPVPSTLPAGAAPAAGGQASGQAEVPPADNSFSPSRQLARRPGLSSPGQVEARLCGDRPANLGRRPVAGV